MMDDLQQDVVITSEAIAILMHRYPYRVAGKFKWDLNFSCTSKWPGPLMSGFFDVWAFRELVRSVKNTLAVRNFQQVLSS